MLKKFLKIFILVNLFFALGSHVFCQQKKYSLHINIENVLIIKGKIHIGLYSNEKNFLQTTYAKIILPVEKLSDGVSFSNLPPGEYSVTIFQDLNNNGILDKAMSLPVEPYGLSNNPSAYPTYANTKFMIKDGSLNITIGIKN